MLSLVTSVICCQCLIYGPATFSKIKSHNQVDDITNQLDLSRLSWRVQEMVGADFFHVKLGQFAHASDFRFQLGGDKMFLRNFF